MRNQAIRWVAVGFAVLLVVVIILADYRHLPSFITMLYSFAYGDRIGHFVLFGLLSFLLRVAFPIPTIRALKREIPVFTLVLVVFIITEEISQIFIPARTFSWGDLAASLAGCGLGWGIGCWVNRKHM
jgi:polysaccharide biosynthesis protein VpsQ